MISVAVALIGAAAWFAAFMFGVQWGGLVMLGGVMLVAAQACEELRQIKKRLPNPADLTSPNEAAASRSDRRRGFAILAVLVALIGAAVYFAGRK
jgi:hypothetical protein